jgi:putative ABC transport system permease protein
MNPSWLHLVLKEFRRRPVRSAVTLLGIAVAVAALASLLAFERGYRRGLASELERLGAHVLVVPKGCPFDAASIALHGANWPCYLRESYLKEVRSVPDVAMAAPALMQATPQADGSSMVVVGVTPEMLGLKTGWKLDGRFPQEGREILVGSGVSRRQAWRLGDQVEVPGLSGRWSVAGILDPTGGADDGFVFLPLEEAQRVLGREGVLTHILVKLRDPEALDGAVGRLRGCDAGMDMNIVPLTHLFRTIQGMIRSTRTWLVAVGLMALVAAITGVCNAVLMALSERTREVGVLRAMGASPGDVFRLFWLETLLNCVVGTALGLFAAASVSRVVESWLRSQLPFTPTDPLVRMGLDIIGLCMVGALCLGSLAGVLPAWRASRLSPQEAIRTPAGR